MFVWCDDEDRFTELLRLNGGNHTGGSAAVNHQVVLG
jgi:hypothetical protein